MIRFRAIATFGAGALLATALATVGPQAWQASAAPGDTDSTFVPTAPCRLIDTRPGDANVGGRTAPLGPAEILPIQVTGANGDCTGASAIPSDAVAVALNATVAGPTERSFLTLYPGDVALPPTASNLNWVAGQAPTPNKVDVKLSPDGRINAFNEAGNVIIIFDVVGYYTASSLTEISTRLASIESANADLAQRVTQLETAKPFVVTSFRLGTSTITNTRASILQVEVTAPVAGRVVVDGGGTAVESTAGNDVRCAISESTTPGDSNNDFIWEASGATANSASGEGDAGELSGTRTFAVDAGETETFHLTCRTTTTGDNGSVWGSSLIATFIAD